MLLRYLLLLAASLSTTGVTFAAVIEKQQTCDCTGTNDTGTTGRTYICRDPRLGPKRLPRSLPLSSFVSDYERFGGLSPGAFLDKWTRNGSYIYPPQNGFQLDTAGNPILGNMTIAVGTNVDRFGSEYGTYISAAASPYSQRALPPSNLDSSDKLEFPYNYHLYEVTKPLVVLGGPIAPWFGQPGLGAQFYVGATGNIMTLIKNGYLKRLNTSELDQAAVRGNSCG